MEPIYHDIPQGSDEWVVIRLAKVTASNFKTAMGKGKGRSDLIDDLEEEYFTRKPRKHIVTDAMRHGTEFEQYARAEYKRQTGLDMKQVGFIEISKHIGVSPDDVGIEEGGAEYKCPLPKTHLKYIRGKKCPTTYLPQVDGCMWATGAKWWDFVSFCPECIDKPYWSIRVPRDEKRIAEIDVKINIFAKELEDRISAITGPRF